MCCNDCDHVCDKVARVEVRILPQEPVTIELEQRFGKGGGVPLRQPRRRWFRSRDQRA